MHRIPDCEIIPVLRVKKKKPCYFDLQELLLSVLYVLCFNLNQHFIEWSTFCVLFSVQILMFFCFYSSEDHEVLQYFLWRVIFIQKRTWCQNLPFICYSVELRVSYHLHIQSLKYLKSSWKEYKLNLLYFKVIICIKIKIYCLNLLQPKKNIPKSEFQSF